MESPKRQRDQDNTLQADISMSDFSKRLEDFHGDSKNYSQYKVLFYSLLQSFYLISGVIMLIAAVALLPLSMTILIICLGQVIFPLLGNFYAAWTSGIKKECFN